LDSNKVILEKFIEYAEQQGYISFRPSLSSLFAMPERAHVAGSEAVQIV